MPRLTRRATLAIPGALAIPGLGGPARAQGAGVLRVGMTAADIPSTTGSPDQGAEGWRTAGTTLYDSLIQWDLTAADRDPVLVPGLATSWAADAADRRRWTVRLRPDVQFHDSSAFDASAVAWNLDSMLRRDAPQYDGRRFGQTLGKLNGIESWRVTDPLSIEIVTRTPDALLPYNLTNFWMVSPARWTAVGRDWNAFAATPAGTGPWRMERLVARERMELAANRDYWDAARRPRADRLVFVPLPDAGARTAALLAGQVDWIEAPSPDALPQLRARGMRVVTNPYPHVWPWFLSTLPDSPFADVRVRQAANLALDREAICALLGGTAQPAVGQMQPGYRWFGEPAFRIRHDPAEARRLLIAAGHGPGNPVTAVAVIAPSGSGQMQPLPMNEAIQEQLAAVGIRVRFEVMDWNTLRQRRSQGAHSPENRGFHAINSSWITNDPDFAFLSVLTSGRIAPAGSNWGNVRDVEVDRMAAAAGAEFDPAAQDALFARLHARMVDQAYWLFVAHDLNARAMSPRVSGFVSARSWTQDFTPVRVAAR